MTMHVVISGIEREELKWRKWENMQNGNTKSRVERKAWQKTKGNLKSREWT